MLEIILKMVKYLLFMKERSNEKGFKKTEIELSMARYAEGGIKK